MVHTTERALSRATGWARFPRHHGRSRPIFLCTAVSAGLLAGCSSSKPQEAPPLVSVEAATVVRKTIQQKIKTDAVLYPRDKAAIVPRITAPIEKFYVDRGSHVHAGQLLATLENKDLAATLTENQGAYQQAESAYASAQESSPHDLKLARQQLEAAQQVFDARQALYRQGAMARKDVEDAGLALTQARNQYALIEKKYNLQAAKGGLTAAKGKLAGAQAQLSYTKILSPISGVITDRPFFAGETPPSGSPILTVMDLSSVVARARFSPQQAAELRVGNEAAIVTGQGEAGTTGKVVVVSPALDPNSTTIQVWVEAPNPGGRLRPGTTVTLSIVARTVKDALVVPAEAILSGSDGAKSVMLIGPNGVVHQTKVETGIQDDREVQIVVGLQPGQKVVTKGAYGLPEGTKVTVSTPAAAAPAAEKPGS